MPDGWWAEAHAPGLGFVIGEEVPPDTGRDAELLFKVLEEELAPLFFERSEDGLPHGWIEMMRASMAAFLFRFSSRRMLQDYASRLYGLPGFETADSAAPPERSATP